MGGKREDYRSPAATRPWPVWFHPLLKREGPRRVSPADLRGKRAEAEESRALHRTANRRLHRREGTGFGAVSLARRMKENRCIALQVMPPQVAVGRTNLDQFLKEIRNVSSLRHPNEVKILPCSSTQEIFCFALERWGLLTKRGSHNLRKSKCSTGRRLLESCLEIVCLPPCVGPQNSFPDAFYRRN